jgi:hypothetical protein
MVDKFYKSSGDRSMSELFEAYASMSDNDIRAMHTEEVINEGIGGAVLGGAASAIAGHEALKAYKKHTDQENFEDRPAAIGIGAEVDIAEERGGGSGIVKEFLPSKTVDNGIYVVETDEGILPVFHSDIFPIG